MSVQRSSSSEMAESPPIIGTSPSNGHHTNPLPLRRCLPPPSSCIATQTTFPFPSFLNECEQVGGLACGDGAGESNHRTGNECIFSKSSAFMRMDPNEAVQAQCSSSAEFSPLPLLKTLSGSTSRSHSYEAIDLSVDNTSENGSGDREDDADHIAGYESDSDRASDVASEDSDDDELEEESILSDDREMRNEPSPKVQYFGEKSISNVHGCKAMQLESSGYQCDSGSNGSDDDDESSNLARPWSKASKGDYHGKEGSSCASSSSGASASISETSHCPGRGVDLVLETSAFSDADDEASSTDAAVIQCNQSASDNDDDSSVDDENTISSGEDCALTRMDGDANSLPFVIESDDLQKTLDDIDELGSLGSRSDVCSRSEEYIDLRFNEEIEEDEDDQNKDKDGNVLEDPKLSDGKERTNIDSEFERALDDSDQDDEADADDVLSTNKEELEAESAALQCFNVHNDAEDNNEIAKNMDGDEVYRTIRKPEGSLLKVEDVSQVMELIESEEENISAVAEALEFDFWTTKLLRKVAGFLKQSLQNRSQVPLVLPPATDTDFWVGNILAIVMPDSPLFESLSNPYLQERVSKLLYNAFNDELTSADVTLVKKSPDDQIVASNKGQVYVGSMNSTESRLAMALLGIKHIIIIASDPPDELWTKDGMKYSIHVLPSCNDQTPTVYDIIEACAVEIADFLNTNNCISEDERGSVLVACSTGNDYACAVGATFLANSLQIDAMSAVEMMQHLRPAANVELSWLPPTWQMFSPPPAPAHLLTPLSKRILSSQRLSLLGDTPKRARCSLEKNRKFSDEEPSEMPDLPAFSLGDSYADKQNPNGICDDLYVLSQNEAYKPSEDDLKQIQQNQQRQLKDELTESVGFKSNSSASPVPLLTPPMTPQHVSGDDEIVEWPSNLTVDAAITSSIDLPRITSQELNQLGAPNPSKSSGLHTSQPSIMVPRYDDVSTGLTPRLNSINFNHSYI